MHQRSAELLEAWQAVEAVDHHCHPLLRPRRHLDAAELRAVFSESLEPRQIAEHVPDTAVYRDALRRLGAELACAPTEAAVLEARARRDPAVHLSALLRGSGTGTLILDHGYLLSGAMDPGEHARTVTLPQREVVRLETLAEGLVSHCRSVGEWLSSVRAELRRAVTEQGAVAVKTICGYRASLHLRPPDRAEVAADYAELRTLAERAEVRLQGEPLCHALLLDAAEEVRRLDVPLQVHCGLGDADSDLAETSPLGLRPLLGGGRHAGLRVVLLHCYPYHREAAYLCAVHADVHMDISLALPQAGLDGGRAMGEVLGLCPWTKLLYATDATALPEAYLVAAQRHREALADALAELVAAAVLSADEAVEAGRRVLAGNAASLYRLAG
ncbi:MAG TPA: amidohydrolase family protein [Candidatus Dormibacteraeota bacterium]|nr:amidohydrolase family protein [Candidatus Dormibacteraeota bacterium]